MKGFRDRGEAGRRLAEALAHYEGSPDLLVLALPRGGVPVGLEVARALGAPLDVMVVRKLGTPGQPELAMGALASGGVRVLNADVVELLGVSDQAIDEVAAAEQRELERRERAYRNDRPFPDVRGRTVILVDDGIATGATVRAAARALRSQGPERLVIAAPVASPSVAAMLRREADEVVCVALPEDFFAISAWYHEFPQLDDHEVRRLLERAGEG
jgi:putative phosphoribosyl transferase